jgi:hypothetical protein
MTRISALTAVAIAFAAATAAHAAAPNFTGKWQTPSFIGALKTTQGARPPLRPEAAAIYAKRVADRAAGRKVNDPVDACLPHGVPRLMFAPYPMLIVQDARQVSIIQQANHTVRLIYIGGVHPEDGDPKWLGHSIAHWGGQSANRTLVVETVQMNDQTWLDKAGLPHSDQMKVTERLKLLASGKTLQDRITIDDPKTYTAPWSTVVSYNKEPGMTLAEQVCSRDHKM